MNVSDLHLALATFPSSAPVALGVMESLKNPEDRMVCLMVEVGEKGATVLMSAPLDLTGMPSQLKKGD